MCTHPNAQVAAGLRQYLDRGLRHHLLYASEQPAAEAALAGGAVPSDVYGGEHLARLLVKLPELAPVAHMGMQASRSPAHACAPFPPSAPYPCTPHSTHPSAQHVLALEARLAELMARLAELRPLAKFFSTPSEYVPNPDAPPPEARTAALGLGLPPMSPAAAPAAVAPTAVAAPS